MRFQHTIKTCATPDAVWKLWTDVAHWPSWDTELLEAHLDGAFMLQARGHLRARRGPVSPFVITQFNSGTSYTFTTQLPLAQLHIQRTLVATSVDTRVTHIITFVGPLGWLFGLVLGRGFRIMLPIVMEHLRELVEQGDSANAQCARTP